MTLGSISVFTGLVGVVNALTAMFKISGVFRWLCVIHCVFVFLVVGCVIGAYVHSGVFWSQLSCPLECSIRLAISGFFFFAFSVVYAVFSLLFAARARAGDDDSLVKR
jgi:hypothetical protein